MFKALYLAVVLLSACATTNQGDVKTQERNPAQATSETKIGLVAAFNWLDDRDDKIQVIAANTVEAYCVTAGYATSQIDTLEPIKSFLPMDSDGKYKATYERQAKVYFRCSGSSGYAAIVNPTLRNDYGLRFLAPNVRKSLDQMISAATRGTSPNPYGQIRPLPCDDKEEVGVLPQQVDYAGSSVVAEVGTYVYDGQVIYVAEPAGDALSINRFQLNSGRSVGVPVTFKLSLNSNDLKILGISTKPKFKSPNCVNVKRD